PADLFVQGIEHHLVQAAAGDFARLAEADLHAGQVLQFDGGVFEDVRRPGAFVQTHDKAARYARSRGVRHQAGQPGHETVGKTGDLVGVKVFEVVNIDHGFDDGRVGPHAGTRQIPDLQYLDVFFAHRSASKAR